MRILASKPQWMEAWDNDTGVKVLVDRIPSLSEMRFIHDDRRRLWYAELDGYVSYFAGHPDKPSDGFGGRSFELTLTTGEIVTLVGPWSSRASVMNQQGWGPCNEAVIQVGTEWDDKQLCFAGNMTIAALEPNLPEGTKLVQIVKSGEPSYVLRRTDGKCHKCNGTGERPRLHPRTTGERTRPCSYCETQGIWPGDREFNRPAAEFSLSRDG